MEQTSATAYPNVLVLEYLRKTGQAGSNNQGKQETMKKAQSVVSSGYQQLVRFQRHDGGFNWWGDQQPANDILTALGLQEFWHMGQVMETDERIVQRARTYLLERQQMDGSWKANTQLHGYNMQLGSSEVIATAYIAWSLLEAGEKGPHMDKAIAYLNGQLAKASEDAYALSLMANALALHSPRSTGAQKALAELAARRTVDAKRPEAGAFIPSKVKTVTYSTGESAAIETTALAAGAFLHAGSHASLTSELLKYLLSVKQPSGSFGSTQATILSLRALILAAGGKKQEGSARVALRLNDASGGTISITPDDYDVTKLVDLKTLTRVGKNKLEVSVSGSSGAQLQIVARHYLPWPPKLDVPKEIPLALDVGYDKTQGKVGEPIQATAEVRYTGKDPTFMVTAELGLPPGMTVDGSALDALVTRGQIARWRQQGSRLVVFLNEVSPGSKHVFKYSLVPRMPVKALAPESVVYEYYTPSNRAVAKPVALEVS